MKVNVERLRLKGERCYISHAKGAEGAEKRLTMMVEGRISLTVDAGAGGVAVTRDGGRRGG